jgi:hypothetical protein
LSARILRSIPRKPEREPTLSDLAIDA